MANIEERVKSILVELTGRDEDSILLDTRFVEDLHFTDLDFEEFTLALEENFNIEIPEGSSAKFRTVRDAIEFLYHVVGDEQ